MKYEVTVMAEMMENGRVDVSISYPKNQEHISFQSTAHILAAGISLLIKVCEKESGMRDYELMEEIIKHLEEQFTSPTAFNDAKIIN